MLYGATGRTDLVSPDDTVELTHAQYHSVRRLVDVAPRRGRGLPDPRLRQLLCRDTDLRRRLDDRRPGPHEPGADPGRAGLRRRSDRRARCLPGLLRAHGPGEHAPGRDPVDLSAPEPVDAGRAAAPAGGRTVGRRPALAHTCSLPATSRTACPSSSLRPFVTYLGWLFPYGEPLTLIGDDPHQIADAQRELVRIGIDRPSGAATGPIEQLADGQELGLLPGRRLRRPRRRPRARRGPLRHRRPHRRRADRRRRRRLGAHPTAPAAVRRHEVPADRAVWIYCGSGYRAAVAASLLAADPDHPRARAGPHQRGLPRRGRGRSRDRRRLIGTRAQHCTRTDSGRITSTDSPDAPSAGTVSVPGPQRNAVPSRRPRISLTPPKNRAVTAIAADEPSAATTSGSASRRTPRADGSGSSAG